MEAKNKEINNLKSQLKYKEKQLESAAAEAKVLEQQNEKLKNELLKT